MNKLLINLTWNSKDWQEESQDKSNHSYIKEGGLPHESWNFKMDADGNTSESIFGFAKFTKQPAIKGKSIFIFYSQDKIVGFYGDGEIIQSDRNGNQLNLKGSRSISFALKNKIDRMADKKYLEDKKRVGRIGFIYLKKDSTVIDILDEALSLNPDQSIEINKLKEWFIVNLGDVSNENDDFEKTISLNQILFGPPGTGKTYNSISEAVKIVDSKFYSNNQHKRDEIEKRFKELLIKDWESTTGQIAFCTFHQSFSYEDFVEGIKPKTTNEKEIYYEIESGVFKRISELADSNNSVVKVINEGKLSWDLDDFKKASFYKISLGDSQKKEDQNIYAYCRDYGYISVGFGENYNFAGLSESEITDKVKELGLEPSVGQSLNYFIHYLKKGNYVLVSNGNKMVRAIGQVTGNYEYQENSPIAHNHFRKVKWLFVDENIPVEDLYDRAFTQRTIYKIDENGLKQNFFTKQGQQDIVESKEDKKYVLIIDEINRGNVSSIFGELITLIEEDKRGGALPVILPYSKTSFQVPANLYIIGTMNTADRSIESLDTALRRRFSFKEYAPKVDLIKTEGAAKNTLGIVDGINLVKLLEIVNNRIEKLIDKDHKIGHSYLIKVKSKADLLHVFKDKVIPLLEEYFFGDFGKIGLVLGSNFVIKENSNDFVFADFKEYDAQNQQDLKERAVFKIAPIESWDFNTIYEPSPNK